LECGRVPPALWCESQDIVRKCGFDEHCERYTRESAGKKLQITLLYESECPGCRKFINEQLFPVVYKQFAEHVDIELVPYGNAKKGKNGTITCQHGSAECETNMLESCAIHVLADPLPFINCLESKLEERPPASPVRPKAIACAKEVNVSREQLNQMFHCIDVGPGPKLQRRAAKRTESAYPDKHGWVPWLIVNNVSLTHLQFVLIKDLHVTICNAFPIRKPPHCGV